VTDITDTGLLPHHHLTKCCTANESPLLRGSKPARVLVVKCSVWMFALRPKLRAANLLWHPPATVWVWWYDHCSLLSIPEEVICICALTGSHRWSWNTSG